LLSIPVSFKVGIICPGLLDLFAFKLFPDMRRSSEGYGSKLFLNTSGCGCFPRSRVRHSMSMSWMASHGLPPQIRDKQAHGRNDCGRCDRTNT